MTDLHWADKPSLLLLQFLAREMAEARLLVVGTYRDVDLGPGHPLEEMLPSFRRERVHERIQLRGLPKDDVRTLLAALGRQEVPEPFVQAIFRETEGNPFFIQETLRHLVDKGILYREGHGWVSHLAPDQISLPKVVGEVIGRRLSRLSDSCRTVLSVAAVVGREFELGLLDRVSAGQADRLTEILEEAVAARVIVEVPRTIGGYSFSHALIREALYGELTATRRVELHRRIAEVLEDLYGPNREPHLAELAYHFFEAAQRGEDADKAIDYAKRAAGRATALLAYEEAAAHYERALRALALKEPNEALRCDLLLARGESQRKAGDNRGARETFLEAVQSARTLGAAERLARAALGYSGRWVRAGSVDETAVGFLEEALAALGESDSRYDRTRSQVWGCRRSLLGL